MVFSLLKMVLAFLCLAAADGCAVDDDCQLNGICAQQKCVCDDAWRGDNCGELNTRVGSIAYSPPNTTAWGGGPPVYDPVAKKYVLYVVEVLKYLCHVCAVDNACFL